MKLLRFKEQKNYIQASVAKKAYNLLNTKKCMKLQSNKREEKINLLP